MISPIKTDYNMNLLMQLKNYSKKIIVISKNSIYESKFRELNLFKKQISNDIGLFNESLIAIQKRVLFYQLIFCAIGLIFLSLESFILTSKMSWTWVLLIGNSHMTKNLLCILCGIFSLSSFVVALTSTVEKEIINRYARSAKKQLYILFSRKKLSFGSLFLSKSYELNSFINLRHSLHDTIHQIKDQKEETFHLMNRISETINLETPEGETLFRQVFGEYTDKLKNIVNSFALSNK